ncbi:hypothetical protein Tco_1071721 [Tanacetum coccineum]
MNDFSRNKHFLEKISSNLKFLNHFQSEWKRHVTTVHQTKNLYEVDYNQLYDFLKMNQEEANEIRAERLAKTHDPLALMANSKNPYNFLNGHIVVQGIANQNANQNENDNVVVAQAKGNGNGNNGDIDEIEKDNANCILMANLQQASTSAQKKQQSLYNGKVLLDKHDPLTVYDLEETLQLAQESRLKMKQLNKEIKPANYAKINKLLEVFVSQKAKSQEELYFSNTFKMTSVSNTVSKPILIHDEEFSDNASSPSVARKFLNEVQKILKDEIAPIVNQVDVRVQNFKIQFLKEAAKFVRDFKSLIKEADESFDKNKILEHENERLLRAVVSQDIMSIVQNNSVVDTSNLQTELDRTKEKLETCIIKKEKEYAIL